jgi:hypothetical protein
MPCPFLEEGAQKLAGATLCFYLVSFWVSTFWEVQEKKKVFQEKKWIKHKKKVL